MAKGTARRQEVQDSLKGAAAYAPAPLPAPNLPAPREAVPDIQNSASARVAQSLVQYSGQQLQTAANAQHEKAALDGQVAAMQGQSMRDIEMEGDKWKLSGYRVVEAQTQVAVMMAAQQEMIRQSQYEQDPAEFRKTFVARMEQQIDGLDPETASLVRQQMAKQAPALVAAQTSAYMQNEERKAYETYVKSIDIMSMDDSQTDGFLDNASGEGGTGGLSIERRKSGLTAGVVAAFQNGNPIAYEKLAQNGLLEQLNPQQQEALRNAKKQYQADLKKQFNAAYIQEHNALMDEVAVGDVEPDVAMARYGELMEKYGYEMDMNDGFAIANSADDANRLYNQGTGFLISAAQQRYAATGDMTDFANIWGNITEQIESGGDPNAVGPLITSGANAGDRAQGIGQVMPKTIADPGYGIKPADINDPADVRRVGREYSALMLSGSAGNKAFKWAPGDMEAAAIAYNAGPANANKWIAAGRDYSVLPDQAQTEAYAKKALKLAGGGPITAQVRRDRAAGVAEQVAEQVALNAYQQLQTERAEIRDEFMAGKMTQQEFTVKVSEVFNKYNRAQTEATVNRTLRDIETFKEGVAVKAEAQAKATGEEVRADALERARASDALAAAQMRAVLNTPGLSEQEYADAVSSYSDDIDAIYGAAGFSRGEYGYGGRIKQAAIAMSEALKRSMIYGNQQTIIDRAKLIGDVQGLSPELRQRAWDQANAEREKFVADGVADGSIDEAMADRVNSEMQIEQWQRMGSVDPSVAALNSSVLRGNLLAKDGKASPAVLGTVMQYKQVMEINPFLGNSFFATAPERARADAILASGGDDTVAGIVAVADVTSNTFKPQNTLSDVERADLADRLAQDFIDSEDVGMVQAVFGNGQYQVFGVVGGDVEAREQQIPGLREEFAATLNRLSKEGNLPPGMLIQAARREVSQRVLVAGTSVVIFPRGKSFMQQTFGTKANEWQEPGVQNEILNNYLINSYSKQPGKEWVTEITGQEIAAPLTNTGIAAWNAVSGLFGADPTDYTAITGLQGISRSIQGVRPYSISYNTQNGRPLISVQDNQGRWSPPEYINLEEVRKSWLKAKGEEFNQ